MFWEMLRWLSPSRQELFDWRKTTGDFRQTTCDN